jgi:hypothetical protein
VERAPPGLFLIGAGGQDFLAEDAPRKFKAARGRAFREQRKQFRGGPAAVERSDQRLRGAVEAIPRADAIPGFEIVRARQAPFAERRGFIFI